MKTLLVPLKCLAIVQPAHDAEKAVSPQTLAEQGLKAGARFPGLADTNHSPDREFQSYQGQYYGSHPGLKPTGFVPVGPDCDFDFPSRRETMA
ncbi:hypothetical protein [Neorhizobium lilium]|uniref:hypothetical protein n=1 Tax=Neorhizobium lilium TaxID=2503024 RepID=UPI001FE166B1|nr:hypothetical protein [Neorhizobium lilium]